MLMHMATLTRRLQILIEEDRYARLEHIARARGTTVAALVRAALDEVYPSETLSARTAAERFLERAPIDIGVWEDAKQEIEESLDRGP